MILKSDDRKTGRMFGVRVDGPPSARRAVLLTAGWLLCVFPLIVAVPKWLPAEDQPPVPRQIQITDRLPYGLSPVDYSRSTDIDDPIRDLSKQIADGKVKLRFDGPNGYLKSVLSALNVPVESQLLVYSKTALNQQLIGPKRPRAIYFNDEVYVAWVPGAAALEISAADPLKGANFYTLPQVTDRKPEFHREESCLACHAGQSSIAIPGHMVRSFQVKENGKPVAGYSRITHETDYAKRWGGWYVTGTHGEVVHMGNLIGQKDNLRFRDDRRVKGNIADLRPFFKTSDYLTPHSDVVAHMVLDHQSHGHNLIARVAMESRFARESDAVEQLVQYLLFCGEAKLDSPVRGTSGFAKQFAKRGPFDRRGRSLRQFDLKTRLFRYRLSFLIYSRSFDGLPETARKKVYQQLWHVLSGADRSPAFQHLAAKERKAIVEIVAETKTDLPDYWKSPAR